MALPLPRVVADVGPGGPLVTAMGGMNSLANDMILRKINQIKAQYAPITAQSEAASKLAYANLMGPQFLAKLLGNPSAIANMGDAAARAALDKAVYAGMGQGTGLNVLNNLPGVNAGFTGIGQPSTNSLSGWIVDKFKNIFHPSSKQNALAMGGSASNPGQYNPPGMAYTAPASRQIPGVDTGRGHPDYNPESEDTINHDIDAAYIDWTNSPEGKAELAKGDQGNMPSVEEVLKWKAAKDGRVPIKMTLTSGQRAPTYAEKTGNYLGTVEEGKELGKIRAKAIDELDQQYQQAVQSEVPLKHMNSIVSNPVFQNLRKFPWFQGMQLDAKAKIGTPEEQKLIGDFQTTALKAVAETVMGFKGRILDKEVSLANDMKINKDDTIGVMLGKLPSIETFQEMTKQRSRLASKLMREQHLNRGDALEQADRMVDGEAIRKRVENQLMPKISDEDINFTAKKYGLTRDQVIQRLKAEGRHNG